MSVLRPAVRFAILVSFSAVSAWTQSVDHGAEAAPRPPSKTVEIPLLVPVGTPLRVALPERVRVQHPGAPVRAVVTKPVYTLDQVVIPEGSELRGRITRIEPVTRKRRILAFANGDFTPARAYQVTFDSLVLPDGKEIAIATQVSPGSADVVRLVSDPGKAKKKGRVAEAAAGAKRQVSDKVHTTLQTIKSPGRMARLKRYLWAQLPARRQYIEEGTRFNAVLEGPLDFGSATRNVEDFAALGSIPADDSVLDARLADNVSSATAHEGTPVEAIVTVPLFSSEHRLVIPANSKLVGEVIRAKPARKLHRNGQLRVVFRRIDLPDGVTRPVQGVLESMEVERAAGLKLDVEGGAQATDSKTRYISTALAILVAAASSGDDAEENPGAEGAAGGSGMRLVGAVGSLAARSQIVGTILGVYGAAASVYSHFLSRGRDVNLAKHTPIEIGLAQPHPPAETPKQ